MSGYECKYWLHKLSRTETKIESTEMPQCGSECFNYRNRQIARKRFVLKEIERLGCKQ